MKPLKAISECIHLMRGCKHISELAVFECTRSNCLHCYGKVVGHHPYSFSKDWTVSHLLQNCSLKGITTVPCWLSAATQQRRGLASIPSLNWQSQAQSQRTSIKKKSQPSSKYLPSSRICQPYSPIPVFLCFGTVPAQQIGNTFTDKHPQLDTAGQRSKLMTQSTATPWWQAGCARLWQAITACTDSPY